MGAATVLLLVTVHSPLRIWRFARRPRMRSYPTVAFDTPVNRAMLGDLGVYAPYGDRAGLTRGLVRLASDPDLRKRLGHALRRRAAEQPSWSGGALALGSLYERLVEKRQSPDRGTLPPRAEDASA